MKNKRMVGGINILVSICLMMTMFITGCQTTGDGVMREVAINSQPEGWVRMNDETEWHEMPYVYKFVTYRNRQSSIQMHFKDKAGRTCNRTIVCTKEGRLMMEGGAFLGAVFGVVGIGSILIDKATGATIQPSMNYFLLRHEDYPYPLALLQAPQAPECKHPAPAAKCDHPAPKPTKDCAPIGSLEYAPSGKCPPPGAVPYDTTGINSAPRTVTRYVTVPVYQGPRVLTIGPTETSTVGPDGTLHTSRTGLIRYGPSKPSAATCNTPAQKRVGLSGPLDVSGSKNK